MVNFVQKEDVFLPIATNKVTVDRATNVILKNVSLDVYIKENVQRTKTVLITIVPFHQVIICVIYCSIWHSLTLLRTVTNRCFWNSGESCDKDFECGKKGKCKEDKCFQSCKENLDCMNEDQCGNEICVPKRCQKDTDCGPDNKCTSKKCIIGCQQHKGQCPDGKNCIDGYCAIPPGSHLFGLLLSLA